MCLFEKVRSEYVSMKKKSLVMIVASMLTLSACGTTQQEVVNDGSFYSEEASEQIECSSEEHEPEYSMEEIQELFFGEWEVSKLLGFSEVQNDYTNYPDGHDIIGNHILINEDVFSSEGLEKYERYQSEVLNPTYEVSEIKQRFLIYNINESIKEEPELYDMIVDDEHQTLEISGIRDGKMNWPPAVEIEICNKELIILTMDGAYYLLEKVQKENGVVKAETLSDLTETLILNEQCSETETDSLEAKIMDNNAAMRIGDFSVFIYESEQEILKKLDMAGLKYKKVDGSESLEYDYYYNVDDDTDGFVQIYFLSEECVRIRLGCNKVSAHTSKGIHPSNTYSQMVQQYGDSYETHTYAGKETYTIYRYKLGEYFHEFGIAGEASDSIYNVDIYVSSQLPIYDYGEELIESQDFS